MRYLLSSGKLVFVKFKHNYNNHEHSIHYGKPMGTSCWMEINGRKIVEAESHCHKHDHFCKRTGRFLAFKKALGILAYRERWQNDGFKGQVDLNKLERRELFNLMWPEYNSKCERFVQLQNSCNQDIQKLKKNTKYWKTFPTTLSKQIKNNTLHLKQRFTEFYNLMMRK